MRSQASRDRHLGAPPEELHSRVMGAVLALHEITGFTPIPDGCAPRDGHSAEAQRLLNLGRENVLRLQGKMGTYEFQ